ncbi:MAG: outer membrane lipoprotein carrier protein LolA [Chloracidobacterium sp.]|nr:outer membrane lipoprotein carrier protein LolA [Chloracidobacterium sp.]
MRKALRYSFFVVSFGLLISSVSVTEAKAQNILGEILKRMDLNNKALQSLTANVTMEKVNVQINDSDIYIGSTSYLPKTAKRGSYIRVDWTKPTEEQMAVIGDNYELYRPRLNQVIVGKVSKAKNSSAVGGPLSFMNMSKAQLQANYSVVYLGEEQVGGTTRTWHIQLTPKTPTSYKMADLWVDPDGMPRQAKITEQNNDTTTVLLSKIEKNVKLDGNMFKLNYPSSAKKIKA